MRDELDSQEDQDERLQSLLKLWAVPKPRPSLDIRVRASFRAHRPTTPLWKRFFAGSITVPVPVAGFAMLVLVSSILIAWHRLNNTAREYRSSPAATEQVTSPDGSEKKAAVTVPAMEEQKKVSAPQSSRNPKSALRIARLNSKLRTSGEMTAYWTELDLTDFKPATEIKVSVIRRPSSYEKNN